MVVVSQSESNYIEGTSRARRAAAAQLRGCCLNPHAALVVKEGAPWVLLSDVAASAPCFSRLAFVVFYVPFT